MRHLLLVLVALVLVLVLALALIRLAMGPVARTSWLRRGRQQHGHGYRLRNESSWERWGAGLWSAFCWRHLGFRNSCRTHCDASVLALIMVGLYGGFCGSSRTRSARRAGGCHLGRGLE